ncbi:cullin, partial [Helicosporidium sp. ATCC 50920]
MLGYRAVAPLPAQLLFACPPLAETTWALLRNAIQEINSHNASGLSFEELYRNAYHMVVYKFGDRLYQGLVQVEREHLSGVAGRIESVGSETFLRTLKSEWEAHVKSVAMIRDILMYLDRIYVRQQGLTPVHSLGLRLWRAVVVGAPPIRERLVSLFLSEVARERRGERGDRSLLRATSQMLEDLGRDEYEAVLEEPYIAATREFYAAEGAAREQADDVPSYLKHVEARLSEEADRVHALLASFSEAKVAGALEAELVA